MRKTVFSILLGLTCWAALVPHSGSWIRGRSEAECVVLLHGIGRSPRSLSRLESALSDRGYRVFNLDYPSTEFPIEYLAEEVLHPLIERLRRESPAKLHFVTHSMGGIVVRYYLQHHDLPNLGRIVMLSPPNGGSELADLLSRSIIFKRLMAPAGRQLGTDAEGLPRRLGGADFELGVIAGNKSYNPINSLILDGPDDGTVTVESTKLPGMTDFIVLGFSHRSIIRSKVVIGQVIHFLRSGAFRHDPGR
ncbi:MAG: alpha/beta fold hydrolase [Candidatus Aminicenantales bacterium]